MVRYEHVTQQGFEVAKTENWLLVVLGYVVIEFLN